jgi:hypothetical protein
MQRVTVEDPPCVTSSRLLQLRRSQASSYVDVVAQHCSTGSIMFHGAKDQLLLVIELCTSRGNENWGAKLCALFGTLMATSTAWHSSPREMACKFCVVGLCIQCSSSRTGLCVRACAIPLLRLFNFQHVFQCRGQPSGLLLPQVCVEANLMCSMWAACWVAV